MCQKPVIRQGRAPNQMNIAFLMNFTRNPAASSARSPVLQRVISQMRRVAGASVRQVWKNVLWVATDEPEMSSACYWPDYLRALAITGLCTAIALPVSPYFGL